MKSIIIGAGFTGIAAAWKLAKAGHQVRLIEANAYPGGLAAGFIQPEWNWSLEHHYHHIFASDKAIQTLVTDMGLSHLLFFSTTKTNILFQNKQYRLDSPQSLFNLPMFNFIDKIKTSATLAYLKVSPFWKNLDHLTAAEFLQKTMGTSVWKTIWEPLFIGKFGEDASLVNAAWFWARIHARTQQLGYFKGGFGFLAEKMLAQLESMGVDIRMQTEVTQIQLNKSKTTVQSIEIKNQSNTTATSLSADQILLAAPAPALLKLIPQLSQSFTQQIQKLKGLGAITLVLESNQPFFSDDTYWLNINEPDWPFLAVVEHTNFINPGNYDGKHIVYVGKYLDPHHPYYALSASQLLKKYQAHLEQLSPDFDQHLQRSWVFKTPFAQPIPHINHRDHVPSVQTPIKNLFWASMQHIYPWDRGTNFSVKLGMDVAQQMIQPID